VWGWKQNERAVELLVKAGADIDAVNESDCSTPRIAAAKAQFLDVSIFIKHGADPNRQDSDGNTALHHVCKSLLPESRHLQEWLAFLDLEIKNNVGETCLYNFRWGNGGKRRVEAIELLIENGLDLEFRNVLGSIALLAACQNGEPHFIRGLLQFGADATVIDFQNKSCNVLVALLFFFN
jgi:ankyrin repeat protein